MKKIPFKLDPSSKEKLYHQLFNNFVTEIKKDTYPIGTKLPSIRNVMQTLEIARNTVTKAYEELESFGYISSQQKSGCFVVSKEPTANPEFNQFSIPKKAKNPDKDILTVDEILKNRQEAEENNTVVLPASKNNFTQQESQEQEEARRSNNTLADCFNKVFAYKSSWSEMNPVAGSLQLRQLISQYLKNKFNIYTKPQNIVLGSSTTILLLNLINLSELQPVQKTSFGGLLKLANKVNNGQNLNTSIASLYASKECSPFILETLASFGKQIQFIPENLESIRSSLLMITQKQMQLKSSFLEAQKSEGNHTPKYFIIEVAEPFSQLEIPDQNTILSGNLNSITNNAIGLSYLILPDNLFSQFENQYAKSGCSISNADQLVLTEFITRQ